MEKICLELPFCKVRNDEPWAGSAYIKEHFPKGCFIIDDGYTYHFAWHDGNGYMNEMGLDRDLVQNAIVESARQAEFMKSFDIIEEIENRLQQIARLTGECKDEVVKSDTRIMDKLSIQRDAEAHEFALIMEGMKGLHEAMPKNVVGGGANILDVAKSYAVIQKPELIKELK